MTVLPLIWPQGRSVEELCDTTREAMLEQLQGPDMEELCDTTKKLDQLNEDSL